jgi:hypothetical protein
VLVSLKMLQLSYTRSFEMLWIKGLKLCFKSKGWNYDKLDLAKCSWTAQIIVFHAWVSGLLNWEIKRVQCILYIHQKCYELPPSVPNDRSFWLF